MTHPEPRQHGPWPPHGQQPQQPPSAQPPYPQPGAPGGPPPGDPPGQPPHGAVPPGGMPPGGGYPPPGPPGPQRPGSHGPQGHYGPQGPYPPQQAGGGRGAGLALIIGAVVLVVLLVAGGGVLYVVTRPGGEDAGASAGAGLEAVRHYEDLSADHVEEGETVEYDVFPPVGGEHYPVWQDCGVYGEPLRTEYAVHSLEHGAVWIAYDPGLDSDQVETLAGLYSPGDYLVISPVEGLPAPVVASAWGSQILLEGAEDPRLIEYLVQYVQGENTPEPGAPCSGGFAGTEAEFDAGGGTSARMDD
ncbi:DUF3105 domain-containing protein [Nocardiopsis tropica]|uniref:DUF3105 domain-containing protein n=1 Tax=Nocardiopsis tropica TaxID=109330 RepID=UPI0031D199FA